MKIRLAEIAFAVFEALCRHVERLELALLEGNLVGCGPAVE